MFLSRKRLTCSTRSTIDIFGVSRERKGGREGGREGGNVHIHK